MVPIRYTGNLDRYYEFLAKFKEKVDKWCDRGFIYRRKDPLDADEEAVLRWLAKHVEYIANAEADAFEGIVRDIESRYPDIADNSKRLSKTVYRVFVGNGYGHDDFPANELVRATDARVCPYCNRVFVECVKGSKGVVRGQLDHFYPKERYPYLAISRYNLVPSCSYCNGPSGKHSIDPMDAGNRMANPYSLADHRGLIFRIDINRPGFLDLLTTAQSINVRIDASADTRLGVNAHVFNLEALYNTHRDYAAEVYHRHRISKSEHYRSFVAQLSGNYPPDDISRIYWGMPVDDSRLGSRPLAKFTKDLIDGFDNAG